TMRSMVTRRPIHSTLCSSMYRFSRYGNRKATSNNTLTSAPSAIHQRFQRIPDAPAIGRQGIGGKNNGAAMAAPCLRRWCASGSSGFFTLARQELEVVHDHLRD